MQCSRMAIQRARYRCTLKLLQTAFTACSCGLNRSNPICGVQLPRVPERDIPRPYSAAEQQKLLEG